MSAVVLVVAAGVSVWWALPRRHPPGSTTAPDPGQAYTLGMARVGERRFEAAAPLLARAAADPSASWYAHFAYGTTLYNLTLEKRRFAGVDRPWARTARGAIQAVRTSLAELDRAEAAAPGDAERAMVWAARARIYIWWGLPRDALDAETRAFALDPRPEYERFCAALRERLASRGATMPGFGEIAPSDVESERRP